MLAIRGRYVGKTFALSGCNEFGERKTRIRRSKEERKRMVEEFIKTYQKFNNGKFPSLRLAHKEVGGSFYTVREIVREIIQENRVLGPAKIIPEEHNMDQILKQYPLGTISAEPQVSGSSSSSEAKLLSYHEGTSGAQCSESDQQGSDSGWMISEFEENKSKDSNQPIPVELRVRETLEQKNNYEADKLEVSTTKSSPMSADVISETLEAQKADELSPVIDNVLAIGTMEKQIKVDAEPLDASSVEFELDPFTTDLMVETFPIRSASKRSYRSDEESSDARKFTDGSKGMKVETMPMEPRRCNSRSVELVVRGAGDMPMTGSDPLEATAPLRVSWAHGLGVGSQFSQSATSPNGIHTKIHDGRSTSRKSAEPISPEAAIALDGTSTSSNIGEPIFPEKKGVTQCRDSSNREIKQSLDRIHLESWDVPGERQTNPFLGLLRTLVAGFVKLWSD